MENETQHTKKKFSINPNLYTPIAIVIAGILIGAGLFAASAWKTSSGSGNGAAAAPVIPNASTLVDSSDPVVGDANAPVVMAYWFDYQCPYCKENEVNTISQVVKEYVVTGKLRIVYKDFAFLGQDSYTLGEVARAVWEVNPQKFADWHHAMFVDQGKEGSGWATTAEIQKVTTSVLSASETTRVMQLAKQKATTYQAAMDSDKNEAVAIGVQGTPAMLVGTQMIGGALPYAQVKAAIDSELSKAKK